MDEMKQLHTNAAGKIDVLSVKHCLQKGDDKLALQYCHELLADNPQHIQTLLFATLASRSLGWLDDALNFINRALELAPEQPAIHSLMGDILLLQKRPECALNALLQARKLGDGSSQISFNIGSAYLALASYEDAKIYFDQALAINSQMVVALVNKGLAEHSLMNLDAAIACFDEALRFEPENIDAKWNKSHVLLTLGRYEEGFRLYEARWTHPKVRLYKRNFDSKSWSGKESLSCKSILLFAEGGFGDTLQFVRYAKLFDEDVELIIQCQKPLVELVKGMGIKAEIITSSDAPPKHDYHCSLMSLPLAFGTTIVDVPRFEQYIFPSQDYLHKWRSLTSNSGNAKIGVVARGSVSHENDRNRSMDLESLLQFLPKTADYFVLQREISEKEKRVISKSDNIMAPGKKLESFSDTAAICEQLDLIVSVDTSVAHLAAAMGKPTVIILPYRPDWRWGASGHETVWYPNATLIRQEHHGGWASAFNCWGSKFPPISRILRFETENMKSTKRGNEKFVIKINSND